MSNSSHRDSIALGGRLPEDFVLPPLGVSGGLGSMYLPADYSLPGTSLYANPYDARPSTAPSLGMGTGARETSQPTPEMLARYRAQAELLSRAGVMPGDGFGGMPTVGPVLSGLYAPDSNNLARYGMPAQAPTWGGPDSHSYAGSDSKDLQDYVHDGRPFPGGGGSAALSSHPPAHAAPYPTIPSSSGHADGSDGHAASAGYGSGVPFPQHHSGHGQHPAHPHHRRSEELSDDYGSDSGVSVPSSANSSSVHLPMGDHGQGGPYEADSASPTLPYQQHARKDDGTGEGGFSSAFGLMSLDDPNVLAGLANDSAPFFSSLESSFAHNAGDPHSANSSSTSLDNFNAASSSTSHTSRSSADHSGLSLPTPTPELLASLKNGGLLSAGGRETLDSKELREFWKQYMRTPLTGPGANTPLFPLQTPTGPGQQLGMTSGSGAGRPSPSRRHSRVASLPSMKTPPILGPGAVQEFTTFPPSSHFSLSLGPKARERQQQHSEGDQGRRQQMSFSNVRTTLHGNPEDLKSYEQAVLARKAPTTLNLAARRRGTLPGGSSAPSMKPSSNMNMSPPQLPAYATAATGSVARLAQATNLNAYTQDQHAYAQDQQDTHNNKLDDLLNQERSGSPSSRLADAFSSPPPHQHHDHESRDQHYYVGQDQQHYVQHQHTQSSQSPRESSVGAESDGAAPASYRPSFKRLASQTLGPPNAKRALLGPAGWDDVRHEAPEAFEEDDEEDERAARRFAGRAYGQHPASRRFSLPAAGAVTLPPLRTAVAQGHDAQSHSPVAGAY
ncbi:hypothetical protein PHLGIDRAFT_35155 [Phlebiopsis gigantea 11061_1 CR5-6]|uniref:Uncharacterized protein n=1 Tax=Phlebiopsis gigantea (strain 11061_1 CR5-6) TaxID=745531 RepID=A0A0C3S957_PHLG1|nr:hypothetical protein PHLGIDRAFT_35155 [Phlebiopsis gigantea 11061_1 CR5-6]